MEDSKIIETVLKGDCEAYAELVRAYQTRVRLVCLAFLGNPDEADDAAQEIFVKTFKALRSFNRTASFETWLLRIADNHCRDVLRAKKRRRQESLDALLEEKGAVVEERMARMGSSNETPSYTPQDLEFL